MWTDSVPGPNGVVGSLGGAGVDPVAGGTGSCEYGAGFWLPGSLPAWDWPDAGPHVAAGAALGSDATSVVAHPCTFAVCASSIAVDTTGESMFKPVVVAVAIVVRPPFTDDVAEKYGSG